jgi:hypothetical protein
VQRLVKIALATSIAFVPTVVVAQRFEAAAVAILSRGNATTGNGVGVSVDGRWRVPRRDWLAFVGSVVATTLGAVALPADEVSVLHADGATLGVSVGPEFSYRFHGMRPYARALGGANLARTRSTFTPFDRTYDFDDVSKLAAYLEFGGGVAIPVAARISIDLGVRRALSSPTVWARNPQGSFDSSVPLPDIEYRRSLRATLWYAGARFAPKRL